MSNLEKARADIEDALTVMAHLEKRQGEFLKSHAETLEYHNATMRRHDLLMHEMEDKLNATIGIIMRREGGSESHDS